jgi:glycosyltransferase involved in cell wall biosynthesis
MPTRDDSSPAKVLFLGQTPPPFHGQALMIDALLRNPMPSLERAHVRLAYSRIGQEIGRIQAGKLWHLGSVLRQSMVAARRTKPEVLYYPPAGPHLVPVLRDIATLSVLRRAIPRTVLHFHAGGISEFYEQRIVGTPLAPAFRDAFFSVDAAILLSPHNPPDGLALRARRVEYIPYGITDEGDGFARPFSMPADELEVLYVGNVIEPKGTRILVQSCVRLWQRGLRFRLTLVGDCSSDMTRHLQNEAGPYVDRLELTGVLTGRAKWERYRKAHIFCFPSFFEAETFGVVCIEAMMFRLPVIATRWRGIQDIVKDGVTGRLVPIQDAAALAAVLETLLLDQGMRASYGEAGRKRYLEHFTLDRYVRATENVLLEVART